jgi:hypothetical protein
VRTPEGVSSESMIGSELLSHSCCQAVEEGNGRVQDALVRMRMGEDVTILFFERALRLIIKK